MTTTTIGSLGLATQLPNGITTFPATGVRSVPAGFQNVAITMHPTTGNPATPFQGVAHPFNSPSLSVTWGLRYSWDGGLTFPDSVERTEVGNASGQWSGAHGSLTMTPAVQLGTVYDSVAASLPPQPPGSLNPAGFPTSYQAYLSAVNGPINSGIVAIETTTP